MADNQSNDELLAKVELLKETITKLTGELDALKERVVTLEEDDVVSPVSTPRSAKKLGVKKSKKKDKDTSKKKAKKKAAKKEKVTNAGEKKGRVKANKATDFYHVVAKKMYVTVPAPFEFGKKHKVPPAKILELDYAYGYNGEKIHGNLLTDREGSELVYCLAGVVVVQDVVDNKRQKHFRGHNEDVLCLAKNPVAQDGCSYFASGQTDPKDAEAGEYKTPYVCIWMNSQDDVKEVARLANVFERAVVSVGWSCDGKYVFAIGGDDAHTGFLWDTSKYCGDGADVSKLHIKSKATCTAGVSKDEVFGQVHAPSQFENQYFWVTYGLKVVKLWYSSTDSDGVTTMKISTLASFSVTKITQKSYTCAAFTKDLDILVGCHSGHIYKFGIETKILIKWFECSKKSPIVSLSCLEDDYYTALDKKGKLFKYDYDSKKLGDEVAIYQAGEHGTATVLAYGDNGVKFVGTKKNNLLSISDDGECKVMMAGHTKEIWALACHAKEPWVCVGCDDKFIRVWNFETKTIVFQKKTKCGIRTADFSRDGVFLATGCTDGSVLVFECNNDWSSKEPLKVAKEEISAVAFSSDNQKIFVGSWDQCLYLLKQKKDGSWKRDGKPFKGHTSSITHVTMSVDGKFAQSCSKDIELLYWDMETGKRSDDVPADVVWDRWNAIFGWPVQGLFCEANDATDVNCCEISGGNENDDEGGNKMVASGDDTGHVTIFKYPILEQEPKYKDQYLAHSAHVTNVRWNEEDTYLFSVGGGDLACFQWSVVDRS